MIEPQVTPKPVRTRQGKAPSDTALKIDNTTHLITTFKFEWLSGDNYKTIIDFNDLNAYCERDYIRALVTKFEQSGWGEPTKCTQFKRISTVLKHAHSKLSKKTDETVYVRFTAETCTRFIMDNYRSISMKGVALSGKRMKLITLGHLRSSHDSILKKFGLPRIPKDMLPIYAHSASLVSNNYSLNELKVIARTLHADRKKWMTKLREEGNNIESITFNKVVYNAIFMMVYYTGASQTELYTAIVDNEVTYNKITGNRISITGIKNRAGGKELPYEITPRKYCQEFLDSYLPLSKAQCEALEIHEHKAFIKFNGSEVSTQLLNRYVQYLYKNYPGLNGCKENGRNFLLNCSRLKSTVKYRTSQKLGYAKGVIAGRHTEGVHQANNYSKSNQADGRQELTLGTLTLETHARNQTGDIAVSINTSKQLLGIEVLTPKKYTATKNSTQIEPLVNGGTCKNLNTPQKLQFFKDLDKNTTLDDDDKKLMDCGYVLKCFMCANFGVVDEVIDIWKLLSFEKRLNESVAMHKSFGHFIGNFGEIKLQIKDIKSRLSPKNLKQAMKRLEREIHPLWNDEHAVDDILRTFNV